MKENVYIRMNNRKYITKVEMITRYLYKFLNKVRVEKIESGMILLLPQNYKRRKIYKCLKKYENFNIIYSNEIKQMLNDSNIKCDYTGKKLMKFILEELIDYVCNLTKCNKFLEDIFIFVNDYSKENLEIIDRLVNSFKIVNIVTSNISKFKILERKYERNNILITVSNNKRKGVKRAKLIVNFDFDNCMFQKYEILNNAIIINLNNEKITPKNNFNGIIINDYNINIDNEKMLYFQEYYGNIETKIMIESCMENTEYYQVKKWLEDYHVKIAKIVGIRGVITPKEVVEICKNNFQNY